MSVLLQLVRLLGNFDPASVVALLGVIQRILDAPDLKTQVREIVSALGLLAKATPFSFDDAVLKIVQTVDTDALVDVILALMKGDDRPLSPEDEHVVFGPAPTLQATPEFAAQKADTVGLDPMVLISLALQIFDLIRLLREQRLSNASS